MTPDNDNLVTTGELGRRLNKLEGKVDSGFEGVQATIIATSTTFVRLDLYLSERDAMKADVDAVKKLAMWTLGMMISVCIGAIILGILSASGVFTS